jgi:hypothetical protein
MEMGMECEFVGDEIDQRGEGLLMDLAHELGGGSYLHD